MSLFTGRKQLQTFLDTPMVLLEMSIVPMGVGDSVSQYVAQCVEIVDQSGLDYELHSMGTIVEGELTDVLALMQRCIEKLAEHSDRVSCAAKLDYRKGRTGRLKSKIESVEQKLWSSDLEVSFSDTAQERTK